MEETAVSTGMSAVTAAVDTVSTMVGKVFDLMVSNPVLIVFLASALLGVGITIFCKLRRAAH